MFFKWHQCISCIYFHTLLRCIVNIWEFLFITRHLNKAGTVFTGVGKYMNTFHLPLFKRRRSRNQTNCCVEKLWKLNISCWGCRCHHCNELKCYVLCVIRVGCFYSKRVNSISVLLPVSAGVQVHTGLIFMQTGRTVICHYDTFMTYYKVADISKPVPTEGVPFKWRKSDEVPPSVQRQWRKCDLLENSACYWLWLHNYEQNTNPNYWSRLFINFRDNISVMYRPMLLLSCGSTFLLINTSLYQIKTYI